MKDLTKLLREARLVFICGNGGSASTAEHLSCDLLSKGIRAISLNSNVSTITMIGNDFGYEYIFSRQLEVLGFVGDVLITISCSGTSKNVVNAKKVAKDRGMTVIDFETFSKDRDYEGLEDRHLKFAHKIKKSL